MLRNIIDLVALANPARVAALDPVRDADLDPAHDADLDPARVGAQNREDAMADAAEVLVRVRPPLRQSPLAHTYQLLHQPLGLPSFQIQRHCTSKKAPEKSPGFQTNVRNRLYSGT